MFPGLNSPNALNLLLKLHIGKGFGGVGKEGLSITKVCLRIPLLRTQGHLAISQKPMGAPVYNSILKQHWFSHIHFLHVWQHCGIGWSSTAGKMYKESVFLQLLYVYVRLVTRCSCHGLSEDLCAGEFWAYVWCAMCFGESKRV